MKQYKIAYLIDRMWTDKAGTESQLLETIKRLDRQLFEPYLVCLYETAWTRENRLPCISSFLGYRGIIHPSFPGVVRRLTQLIARERFEIIQTFFDDSIYACYMATLFCSHRPILISSRRDLGLGKGQPWSHGLLRRGLRLVNSHFDEILVNAEVIRDHITHFEKAPRSKVTVLPNGIDPSYVPASLPDIFRRCPGYLRIGITANLSPVKRIDVFLRALAALRDEHNIGAFEAVILGGGSEEPNLRELAATLALDGRVTFVGVVADVAPYLQYLDIAVLCSDSEGLSNAILEYMKFSLPVVITRVGGNTELVDDSNGIRVPPNDPRALADALASLAKDPTLRARMGSVSREKLISRYTWERAISDLQQYYLRLLRSHPRGKIRTPARPISVSDSR